MILCYVRNGKAYFTDQPLDKQWGDDWDDAPYEYNAGPPYTDAGVQITCLYFEGLFLTPDDGHTNSPWSVEMINRGEVAWLRSDGGTSPPIMAGTTMEDFIARIRAAGGKVFVELKD